MARRGKWKSVIDESEEDVLVKATVSISSDDEDANADLVLKVAERATVSRCENRLAESENGDILISIEDGESTRKKKKKKDKSKKSKKQKIEIEEEAVLTEKKDEMIGDKFENPLVASEVEELIDGPIDTGSENTVLRRLLRGPRYFDPPESGSHACFNCGENGHIAANCNLPAKKKKPCFVCGSFDHNAKKCLAGIDCFICKQPGHRAKDCKERCKLMQNDIIMCLKCGESGHDMFNCRNNYPIEDLKLIQCYVCKKIGHVCCAKFKDSNKTVISCYRCGESGHDGLTCALSKDDDAILTSKVTKAFHLPSSPQARKIKKKMTSKSASQVIDKPRPEKEKKVDKSGYSTPKGCKKRGGWIVDDPGDVESVNSRKNKHKSSSSTPKWNSSVHSHGKTSTGFFNGYSYETPYQSRNCSNDGYHGSNVANYPFESPASGMYNSHSSKNSDRSRRLYDTHHHYNSSSRRSRDHTNHHSNGYRNSHQV